MRKSTSWGKIAVWYNNLLEKSSKSYQKDLILPNLLRLLQLKKEEVVLDLACGQGFFAREFAKTGVKVVGADISKELIEIARHLPGAQKRHLKIEYHVASSDQLGFLEDKSVDKAVIVLALQNIEKVGETLKETVRILKEKGRLFIVLNHPAFRIPKKSSWGWDDKLKTQYRRLDGYLSESNEQIQMHPGENPKEKTMSFHRPLQYYFKILTNSGFLISRLEEWTSNRESEPGPRKNIEDSARREFPLFLFLEAIKKAQ